MSVYKYDIALSFLAEDEELVTSVYQLLKGRVKCFLYSEEQKRLAGNDGEVEFNKVFEQEARTVAVFYREAWGTTPWTRIEETAIRNRAFVEGYDFVYFIPLDEKASVPKWLPKTQLWLSKNRWGIEGVAAILESRIQGFGGEVKQENLVDSVIKAKEDVEGELRRRHILDSEKGLSLASKEVAWIKTYLEEQVSELKESVDNWHIKIEPNESSGVNLISYGISLAVQWHLSYANSLMGSNLRVAIFKGVIGNPYYDPFAQPQALTDDRLVFDLNTVGQSGWSVKERPKTFQTSRKLIDKRLKDFLDLVVKKRKEENY